MALALDTATGYLWLMNGTGTGDGSCHAGWTCAHDLEAYDRTGVMRDVIHTASLTPDNMWMGFGGEMATPEPNTLALLGAGVLALIWRFRRDTA
jgi:hypothetical protein